MYHVDITADLNDEDETSYVWTFLDVDHRGTSVPDGMATRWSSRSFVDTSSCR